MPIYSLKVVVLQNGKNYHGAGREGGRGINQEQSVISSFSCT